MTTTTDIRIVKTDKLLIPCFSLNSSKWLLSKGRYNIYTILHVCSLVFRGIVNHQHYDRRTQTQCNLHTHTAWSEQLLTLINAYLLWKHGSHGSDGDDHTTDHMFEVCDVGIMGMFLSPCTMRSYSRLLYRS